MKKAEVIKSYDTPTPQDLEKINTYTRRQYTSDEVYVFSVVLCDNDVDRDFERFTVEALFEMEKLFVGKTGICDHNPKAENQRARIFECAVESREGRKTRTGDDYFCLCAKAYMPKTEANAEMISRIDSGICKEVSVGCSAKSAVCSVCSKERGKEGCFHIPGEIYGDTLCYFELCDISDAYEWSFVAVPAQPSAGVIKSLDKEGRKDTTDMNEILKSLTQGDSVTLTVGDSKRLADYITRLEKRAEQGDEYRAEIESEFLRLSAIVQPEICEKTIKRVAQSLDVKEMREFCAAYRKKAEETFSPVARLMHKDKDISDAEKNKEFSI